MKFDDSDKDYFLHDFDKEEENTGSAQPQQPVLPSSADGSGQNGPTSPHFDFTSSTPGGEPQQPAPAPRRRHRKGWIIFFLILFLLLAGTVTVRYFVPYITESQVTGYVTLVEKRGIIFRTFEAEMVSEGQLADTGRVYSRDVYFSIPDDSLARRLQQYQGSGQPVKVTCKKYYGTLPWRGASNTVMVSFTPVDRK